VTDLLLSAPSGPSAAFFDLDRTLIAGSSVFVVATEARAAGLVSTRQFATDLVSALAFRLKGISDDKSDEVGRRILGAVIGLRQDDLLALNAEVLPKLLGKIRPETRRLLDLHRHAGRATYIVSAAPVEIVEPLALALGMTAGIGTRSRIVDGMYTGELDGPVCYGEGKLAAIEQVAGRHGLDLAQCYAYSDSVSDLPMLAAVGHPVAVNPDAGLHRHAGQHGWPVVHFRQRTRTVIRRAGAAAAATGIAAGSFAGGVWYARIAAR
jgi:HAD superfamily hydrolase (TIGR01490 family)